MEFSTPMLKQYMAIKRQYPDCFLFYRMGDFYELFMEDAIEGSQILNITLTSKSGGKDGKVPMAGVPYHAVDSYLAKLVKAGKKVAICEQLSPPNKKGLVERDVVRIVTPGTIMDEKNLDKKENNHIISLVIDKDIIGITAADISTGYFGTTQIQFDDLEKTIQDMLSQLSPVECILPEYIYNDASVLKLLKKIKGLNIFKYSDWEIYAQNPKKYLHEHFRVATLSSFNLDNKPLALIASSTLLGYLTETQKGKVTHIRKISSIGTDEGLLLDKSTMINLELFSTIREHDIKGSLLFCIDNTLTAMGGRLLKQWLKRPLINKEMIEHRFDAVDFFLKKSEYKELVRQELISIPDIERLLSRLSVGLGNARDLVNLKHALFTIMEMKNLLDKCDSALLKEQEKNISEKIKKVITCIEEVFVLEPPISIREGGMINRGINKELDRLLDTIGNSKQWLLQLEKEEKEKSGISTLKVRFNKVFGFYIEISKANAHLAPSHFMRKQTLVNAERFITKELKEHEDIILTAEERINEIEYKIFNETLAFVLKYTQDIQKAAESIATVDCISNFAFIAQKYHYVRPTLLFSGEIKIKDGRHPVVERLLEQTEFVPNDITLDSTSQQLLLITGPNMAGKSVLIRQVALIVLMSQMGCFVPATSAHLSVTDKIFVRSGASDVITAGLSTFMVEMVETAYILQTATKNSLIVMDEIGRGTSTYDGISIAWAVAEYLVTKIKPSPKTLFATHYHELQTLEKEYPNSIKNFHMAVTEDKGEPVFLHSILPGGASHSFGVAVARLAGVPQEVIDKAYEILQTLEWRDVERGKTYFPPTEIENISTQQVAEHIIHKHLESLDVANLTPLEALNILADLKEKLKLAKQESKHFKEVD